MIFKIEESGINFLDRTSSSFLFFELDELHLFTFAALIKLIKIEPFLIELENHPFPVVDVRSPSEFAKGHIPGSINLPLLSDEHRHLVGIRYKEEGQASAVELGFELVGHLFHHYIKRAKEIAPAGKICVYCWRGGLRSNIMAWVLSTAGFDVSVIEGGYKSFRKLAVRLFEKPWH